MGLTKEQAVYALASILHSSILGILAYGIYTAVYCVALYLTLAPSRATERPRIGSAIFITVMWIFVTIHTCLAWVSLDKVYIQHGATLRTQFSWAILSVYEDLPRTIADEAAILISVILADITMIWRCWVLYGRRWHIVIIPGLCLVTGLGCYIRRSFFIFSSAVGSAISDEIANMELVFLSTTVFTDLFCTLAVVHRIISIAGWRKSVKTYRRLIEILVESSVLYTAIYAIAMGLQIQGQYFTDELDERSLFARHLGYSITGIAPTLIIARVAAGFARPDDSWTRPSLPHMRSTMRSLAESLHFAQSVMGSAVDDTDLERSIWPEVASAAAEDDETHRQTSNDREKEIGKTSFEGV